MVHLITCRRHRSHFGSKKGEIGRDELLRKLWASMDEEHGCMLLQDAMVMHRSSSLKSRMEQHALLFSQMDNVIQSMEPLRMQLEDNIDSNSRTSLQASLREKEASRLSIQQEITDFSCTDFPIADDSKRFRLEQWAEVAKATCELAMDCVRKKYIHLGHCNHDLRCRLFWHTFESNNADDMKLLLSQDHYYFQPGGRCHPINSPKRDAGGWSRSGRQRWVMMLNLEDRVDVLRVMLTCHHLDVNAYVRDYCGVVVTTVLSRCMMLQSDHNHYPYGSYGSEQCLRLLVADKRFSIAKLSDLNPSDIWETSLDLGFHNHGFRSDYVTHNFELHAGPQPMPRMHYPFDRIEKLHGRLELIIQHEHDRLESIVDLTYRLMEQKRLYDLVPTMLGFLSDETSVVLQEKHYVCVIPRDGTLRRELSRTPVLNHMKRMKQLYKRRVGSPVRIVGIFFFGNVPVEVHGVITAIPDNFRYTVTCSYFMNPAQHVFGRYELEVHPPKEAVHALFVDQQIPAAATNIKHRLQEFDPINVFAFNIFYIVSTHLIIYKIIFKIEKNRFEKKWSSVFRQIAPNSRATAA